MVGCSCRRSFACGCEERRFGCAGGPTHDADSKGESSGAAREGGGRESSGAGEEKEKRRTNDCGHEAGSNREETHSKAKENQPFNV